MKMTAQGQTGRTVQLNSVTVNIPTYLEREKMLCKLYTDIFKFTRLGPNGDTRRFLQ